MASITFGQAREYLNRWKLVKEAEIEELRATPLETKLQQLTVLMSSRHLFRDDPDRESRVREVRDRWIRIGEALRG